MVHVDAWHEPSYEEKNESTPPPWGEGWMEVFFNLVGDSYNMILFLKDWGQSSWKKELEESLLQNYKQD